MRITGDLEFELEVQLNLPDDLSHERKQEILQSVSKMIQTGKMWAGSRELRPTVLVLPATHPTLSIHVRIPDVAIT